MQQAAQRRPGWSVRTRIVASILVVTAVGMAVAGTAAYLVQRERVLHSVEARLTQTIEHLRYVAEGHPLTGEPTAEPVRYPSLRELMRTMVQQIAPRTNAATLGIVDGRAAYVPGITTTFDLAHDPRFVARVWQETIRSDTAVMGTADTAARSLRYLGVPVAVAGAPGRGVFVMAYDLDAELDSVNDAFRTYLIVAAAALLVVGLVGWAVAGRLLRPIRSLRETAERIGLSDLSERIPVRGHDDVSALTTTVNDMLARLQASADAQRRLLDDVGHELKTPLTIVRGHLEVLDENDPGDVAQTRELVLDELDRTTGLVDDISALAAVQRPQSLATRPVDLAELTARVTRKASALSDRHRWVCEPGPAVRVTLDVDRITQAWLQLAANAAQHAPDGSAVTLHSAVVGEQVRLSVVDEGPGIPPDAHARIFERFGRAGEGRGSEGSGLGLAIVAAIARAHGGSVGLESQVGAGSTFTVELPLARTPAGDARDGDAERDASSERTE